MRDLAPVASLLLADFDIGHLPYVRDLAPVASSILADFDTSANVALILQQSSEASHMLPTAPRRSHIISGET